MAITQNTFTGNGSNLGPFSFTFNWLESTDIKVEVAGVLKIAGTHYNLQALNYTTKNGGQVLFTAGNAPANNAAIRIYRDTEDSALSATFFSGSAIRAQDLNDNFLQNLYISQESETNVANAVAGQIPNNSIGTVQLADGAVTDVKVTSIGSSKINFTQAGTGAVQRSVESKLRELISVKDFGAVGDGVTDDTAAIQAAINATRAVRGGLFFPPSNVAATYKITAPLTCDGPISIIGNSISSVTIYAVGLTSGQYMLDFNLPSTSNYFFDIQNITLRSDNGSPHGIRLKNASYCNFKNIEFYTLSTGLVITGNNCFSNYFENLVGYNLGGRTVNFQNFAGGGHYTFNHCTFTGNYGFEVDSASFITQLSLNSCNFEQCTINSLSIVGTVQGISINSCRTEGLDGSADFLFYPSAGNEVTGISITGCYFTSDAGASVPIILGGNGGQVRGFAITGNHVEYAAFNNFVTLNGDGESGIIAGNYFNSNTTTPTNTTRNGVTIFSNENASGKCAEYWGTALLAFTQNTFTPSWIGTTVAGNTVPRNSYGKYNRQGNAVSISIIGDYLLNSYTTLPTGQVRINGLPFAGTTFDQFVSVQASAVDHTMPLVGVIPANQSYMLIYQEQTSRFNTIAPLDWTAIRDPFGQLSLQFTYFI